MRTALLVCGVLSALLYLGMNVFVPMRWDGYSRALQPISELFAIGAPTRSVWVSLNVVYSLLVVAFGWGVRKTAQSNRRTRIAGTLLIVGGLLGLYIPPMHLRHEPFTLVDLLHAAWSVESLLMMPAVMGLAAVAFGRKFLVYTIATLVVWLVFGTLTSIDSLRLARHEPTSWLGVWERITFAAYMFWLVVFVALLLRHRKDEAGAISRPRAQDPTLITSA